MEQPTDISQFEQPTLQSLLGDSTTSLIPESLVNTLIVSFVIINVLGILFLIFYVLGIIRKWKVQSAVLHMQKDLAEIKATLADQQKPVIVPPAAPAAKNPVIAEESRPSSDTQLS